MFTKDQIKKFLFLDVETAGSYPDLASLHDQNHRLWELWLKREKYYRSAYPHLESAESDEIYVSKAGLEPEFSKIVCISFGSFTEEGDMRFISFYGEDETDNLNKAFKVLNNAASKGWKLCGHNIKGFDIPCIGKRMIYNHIEPPINLRIWDKKPWELQFIDTSDIFAFGSWIQQKYLSLDLLACSLGVQSPKGLMDGSMVHSRFWSGGENETIKDYCELDVKTVMQVMDKICFTS
jgi:predicted PolB exonuclease-like 3'-5' exonuclease